MAKTKPIIPSKASPPAAAKSRLARHRPSAASIRETIESVAIAFVLAFLFRTFEAEAFVIPTGSMAPTLMGRHKDVRCKICDYPYQVSASEEVTREGQSKTNNDQIASCTCPMCRYTMEIDGRNPAPSYSGDRIIVNKFSYQFDDPKRWDVIVFYYPEGRTTITSNAWPDCRMKRFAYVLATFGSATIKTAPEEMAERRSFR